MARERELTGPELIELIGQYPTLDLFLDRDPHAKPYTDEELGNRVKAERYHRAFFNIKTAEAKAKRQGVEQPQETSDDGTSN